MSKEYFPMYHSYREKFKNLSDQELGRLVRAALDYSVTGTYPELKGREALVFDFVVYDIDRAAKNSAKTSETNRENAYKRWDKQKSNNANACETMRNDATACDGMRNDAAACLTNTSTITITKTKSTPPKPPKGADADGFDEFWAAYPRKVGKGDALKAWKKIKPSGELRSRISAAIEAAKGCEQWQRENGRFIPNPATWLNQGRWDDDYGVAAPGSREAEMNDLVAEFMRDRGKG